MSEPFPFPTQNDVAAAAGVARSTVSRALKNHPSIPEETRKRIAQVAAQIGYRENPYVTANMQRVRSAQPLRSQALIAFITPYPLREWSREVPSYRKIYDAAKQRASELGFEMDPISILDQSLSGRRCNDILVARGVDGVLVGPFENPFVRLKLDWRRFSVATLGFAHVNPRFSHAAPNHYHNMCLAIRKLHRLGYRRIGLAIPARADSYAQGTFQAAYLLYSSKVAPKYRVPEFVTDAANWSDGPFLKWYMENRPEAIICLTQHVPVWLAQHKIDVPGEVGMVILSRHENEPDWSGIDQHTGLVGSAGVEIVAEQLMLNQRGCPAYPKTVFIEGEWIPGSSTRRLRDPHILSA
jgi:LacI family transcriptional regulator